MTPLLFALLLEARAVELRHQLPPLLLIAVIAHESGGKTRLITRERDGHCSVGAAQVLVRGCARRRVQLLLGLRANLEAGAAELARARAVCRQHPRQHCCRRYWVGAYNCGSRHYARRVLSWWAWLAESSIEGSV